MTADLHTALGAADSHDEPRRRDDAALRVEIGHTGDDGETCVRVYRDGKYRRALWVPADVLAVLTREAEIAQLKADLAEARAELRHMNNIAESLRRAHELDCTAAIERDLMRPVYDAAVAWAKDQATWKTTLEATDALLAAVDQLDQAAPAEDRPQFVGETGPEDLARCEHGLPDFACKQGHGADRG